MKESIRTTFGINSKAADSLDKILEEINDPIILSHVYKEIHKLIHRVKQLSVLDPKAQMYFLQLVIIERQKFVNQQNFPEVVHTHLQNVLRTIYRQQIRPITEINKENNYLRK